MKLKTEYKSLLKLTLFSSVLAAASFHSLQAQTNNASTRLPDVVVEGESEYIETVQGPFLPSVQGTKINSGKKSVVIDMDELPKVINNNYRQALSMTPGLLLSEESTPLVSIGYRGLNPHRAQFTQVLKDGIPIHADMFGYPEAYYTPPLDTVDRIEFLHGGASLMYGPQPGGALNYVTHRPRTDKKFSARTQHIFGSDDLYSTFNSVDGTEGRLGYYAYFNHRQSEGFRSDNSDVELYAGSAKLVLDADKDSRWIFNFDGYAEEHGEPGGLTRAAHDNDQDDASRLFDRFRLERYVASLAWEKDFSENTMMTIQSWGGYYSRFSKRQRGGGFGTLPTGASANSNTIELQEFYTQGIESRLRHDWTWGENTHTLAGGIMLYHTDSPRTDKRGTTPDAEDGVVRNESDRDTFYAPIFVENRFNFGKFSVTPGVRLENIWQGAEEEVNLDKSTATIPKPLGDKSEHVFVPLFGLGLEYELRPKISAYGNVSQAYRPKIFTEAVPTGTTSIINDDLEEGKSWQYEIGLRGNPTPYLNWDASLFLLDFDNQIGSVSITNIGGMATNISRFENVGRAIHKGAEATLELDLVGLYDSLDETDYAERWGSFSLYGNAMLLDAEIVSSQVPGVDLEGNTPQYAPDYIFRTGAIYRWRDRLKVAFIGTFVDEHFANDNNTSQFFIPNYNVWDLTLEAKVHENVSVLAGINNIFDENYTSRIRGDGIDPAYGRNFYAGLSLAF